MSSAPVLAQSAAPVSVASRSGATTEDTNELFTSHLLPALIIIAVLAAAILLTGNDEGPNSP
jgi:hypothetical protein